MVQTHVRTTIPKPFAIAQLVFWALQHQLTFEMSEENPDELLLANRPVTVDEYGVFLSIDPALLGTLLNLNQHVAAAFAVNTALNLGGQVPRVSQIHDEIQIEFTPASSVLPDSLPDRPRSSLGDNWVEERTNRGFQRVDFADRYNVACSLQQSSLIGDEEGAFDRPGFTAIWLGVNEPDPRIMCSDAEAAGVPRQAINGWQPYPIPEQVSTNDRMHLTRPQVVKLIEYLQFWVDTGRLYSPAAD